MMKVPYFVPWINDADKKAVLKSLNQRWLTNGPNLRKFENKFSKDIGTKHAIGVGSATHALHLSMKSIGIGPGDEVIVPTFTFAATANAVLYCGAKPILTDVDNETFNILPKEIRKNITEKTKAITVVHYGGQSCDMSEIVSIAKEKKIKIIEDCAHSLGSTFQDKKCGSIGNVGCFSFYPTKVITTGEGGMITTDDKMIFDKSNILRSQGMSIQAKDREVNSLWKYDVTELGYNYRMDEIRASLGLAQITRLTKINQLRVKIAQKYNKLIKKINGISIPVKKLDRNHIYHLYTLKIEKEYHMTRDELFEKLAKKGIGTSVQYFPLHLMSLYLKTYKNKKHNFPNANDLKDKVLCLPIYPQMTDREIQYVVSNLK
jgi:dTDP-4-amino-4,6-dideoxygalactose transaminase